MAVHTPETHLPEFMRNWPAWQKKVALVGAVATAVATGLAANVVTGLIDRPAKPVEPVATTPHNPTAITPESLSK